MRRMKPELLDSTTWFDCAWDPIYTLKVYKESIGDDEVLLPQRDNLINDGTTLPPKVVAQSGRPKKIRYKRLGAKAAC